MTDAGKSRKHILCMIALAMVVCTFFTLVQPIIAFAAENEPSFDQTDVLSDLESSEIGGKPFSVADYPYDENGNIRVIAFVEYCYSYKANLRENYGLYVYVYNPTGESLSMSEAQNKIQMAVAYDDQGNASAYEKFGLKFCSKTDKAEYKNLFYKFKVVDHKVNGTTIAERVNSNARRYDISGVEIAMQGESTATEYLLAGTYVFTGYAKGYGPDPNASSSLRCTIDFLETVELSVKHTYYRSRTSNLGAGYQKQLDTVYFSVPKRLIDTYGELQRIKAEWYEYKTNDIIVTSHNGFYQKALPYVGVYMGDLDNVTHLYDYHSDVYYKLCQDPQSGGGMSMAKWGWNLDDYLHPACQRLVYLFYVEDIDGYDPYAKETDIGGVESRDLYTWIMSYTKSYEKGSLPIKSGSISADLFTDDIDETRKLVSAQGVIQKGYSYYDFDADLDLQVLSSWSDSSPSFWENWVNFGLGAALNGGPTEPSREVAPIQIVKASDLVGTNEEIAERLLVNVNDVDDIKAEYHKASGSKETLDEETVLVLFRFATSDYYSSDVNIIDPSGGFLGSEKHITGQAYRVQQSVFLDFDIIQLTFHKDGELTVIPAVSSPIDIINAITPPFLGTDTLPWWQLVLAILLLLLVLTVLAPLLPYVMRLILCILVLPIKLGIALVKNARRRRHDLEE